MRTRILYSIPSGKKMAEFRDGELIWCSDEFSVPKEEFPTIVGDIEPYRSMIDGSIINSRSRHREHLRQHGCIEIGNDSSLHGKPKPLQSPPGLKEDIIRATNEVLERRR